MEGELPGDGLAAYRYDGDNLMLALARKIVSGEEDEAETIEAISAQARDAESTAEEYLVDYGWMLVDVEAAAARVNGNRHPTPSASGRRSSLSLATGIMTTGRDPRGGPRATAVSAFVGGVRGVHGRGAGQAQGPQPQAPAHHPLDVRVGADPGGSRSAQEANRAVPSCTNRGGRRYISDGLFTL